MFGQVIKRMGVARIWENVEDVDEILSVREDLENIEILYSNPRTEMAIKKKIHQSFKVCRRHEGCN